MNDSECKFVPDICIMKFILSVTVIIKILCFYVWAVWTLLSSHYIYAFLVAPDVVCTDLLASPDLCKGM
jgi:hypothetical protein